MWMLSCVILLMLVTCAAGQDAAAVRHVQRPVLIGNEHNPMLSLTLDLTAGPAELRAITLEVEGSEQLESLQWFLSGGKGDFSTRQPLGEPMPADPAITLREPAALEQGVHHLWLSCRVKPDTELGTTVTARVTLVDTSAGAAAAPLEHMPGVRQRIGLALRRAGEDGVHTSRIPVLATTPRGTLLCAFDLRRRMARDLQEDIDIGLLRSTDGGHTWEPLRVIMDMDEYGGLPQEENGVSDPGVIVDPHTGEIFVFAVWMHGRPGTHQWKKGGSEPGFVIGESAQFMMVSSVDDGRTWSPPRNMTREWKRPEWILYAPSPQQGIALKDGTLVMPTQGRDAEDRSFSNLLVSQDHGRTWRVSEPASFGNGECQAVELSDGSIMLNARTGKSVGFRSVMVTRDLGLTWEAHPTHRNTLIEPTCNGSLYRFDHNGRSLLLFANPHDRTSRTMHTIQVSIDQGMTWPAEHRILLDEGRGFGYPSLSKIDDRHVGIVYEGSGAHVVFEKLAIMELLEPKRVEDAAVIE